MNHHSQLAHQVIEEVQKAVIGKQDCIEKVMMAILSSGHILLEDIPGVGKTTMALAFSRVLNLKRETAYLYSRRIACRFNRIYHVSERNQ